MSQRGICVGDRGDDVLLRPRGAQQRGEYSHASAVTIRLAQRDGHLEFSVTDDGIGFDQHGTSYGTGLQGMADRLDAVAGSLRVRSAPGEGATITGTLPVKERGG